MRVSQSPTPSSIDLCGLPPRVGEAVAQVVAFCREQLRSEPSPEAFEEGERQVRETMNTLGCEVLGASIENRDGGASRIERSGQNWFRVAETPKTIMTSLGPVTYRRARYRNGASRTSLVPVDDSLGPRRRLPDAAGGSTRADDDGPLHGAGSGGVFREDRRHDGVCEHPAAPDPEHARALGEPRPGDTGQHPWRRGQPQTQHVVKPGSEG